MAHPSPLKQLHQHAEAAIVPYGPTPDDPARAVELVLNFGDIDIEYSAVRKACVLTDESHRGVIELTGPDRLEFLNRMVTQELKKFPEFSSRNSFWLNRKGRIDADLRVINLPDRLLLLLDAHAVARTAPGLEAFVITEDVTIKDRTGETHILGLHGPTASLLFETLATATAGPAPGELAANGVACVRLFGHDVVVDRADTTGETGLSLIVPAGAAVEIYQKLLEAGAEHDCAPHSAPGQTLAARVRLRPAGWHAFNIARIEAGTPLYYLDFGPDSLPAETGVLNDRVSFTKGCYLGQEVVARMHARGHSKRELVALKLERDVDPATNEPLQPVTGAHIFRSGDPAQASDPVGAVTSSIVSPMLGGIPVCFAPVKQDVRAPGTELYVHAGATLLKGVVQPSLRFWSRTGAG